MIKLNTINVIVVLFVVLIVSTLTLGVAFQTSAFQDSSHAGHDHAAHENTGGQAQQWQQALNSGEQAGVQEYTCSMHPSLRSTDPNERCPICGMELIPVAASSSDDEFVRIEFSGRNLALLGLQTEHVQRGSANHEIRLTGQIEFDERALTTISAWTSGRIERLLVNYTGAYVEAEQALIELYSPELLVAQQELLQAHRHMEPSGSNAAGPDFLRASQATTYRAARERLRLLGLAAEQIDQVISSGEASDRVTIYAPSEGLVVTRNIRQGDYVNTGDTLLELANENQLWALFEVFERDLEFIQRGQHVEFQLGSNNETYHGEVVSIAPRIDADRRTRTVRVALRDFSPNAGQSFVPGAFTRATVQVQVENVLTIPASAALITGKRAVVYLQTEAGGGEFEARTIALGRRLGDRYEVLDGLHEHEIIVSRGAFRIDSELQLRGRPSMMAPEGGGATGHEQHEHSAAGAVEFDASLALAPLFSAYHEMWHALHSDSLSDWQNAAEAFYAAVEAETWPHALNEIEQQLSSGLGHAQHVSGLATARDHFYNHSQAMITLAEAGYHQGELNLMFCPMARRGDGAYWLQQSDELLNPYFGSRMLRCGDVVRALSEHPSKSGEHES